MILQIIPELENTSERCKARRLSEGTMQKVGIICARGSNDWMLNIIKQKGTKICDSSPWHN